MLVLTRRTGEAICIGSDVVVTVVATRGQKARIGIQAPARVRVDREEVRHRKSDGHPELLQEVP